MEYNQAKYRITYEAFSRYSSRLSAIDSVEELMAVTKNNLKYFFNFHYVQITILNDQQAKRFSFTLNDFRQEKNVTDFCDIEKRIFRDHIPFMTTICSEKLAKMVHLPLKKIDHPQLYSSFFDYLADEVCAIVVFDEHRHFSTEDIDFFRMLIDTFIGKLVQIELQAELRKKNEKLKNAFAEIESKTAEIEEIVARQQKIIQQRTEHLKLKNEKLTELLQFSCHNFREPLSRIIGLLQLVQFTDRDDFEKNILPYLLESGKDLDVILKEVIQKITEDIQQLALSNRL